MSHMAGQLEKSCPVRNRGLESLASLKRVVYSGNQTWNEVVESDFRPYLYHEVRSAIGVGREAEEKERKGLLSISDL